MYRSGPEPVPAGVVTVTCPEPVNGGTATDSDVLPASVTRAMVPLMRTTFFSSVELKPEPLMVSAAAGAAMGADRLSIAGPVGIAVENKPGLVAEPRPLTE